MFEDKEFVYTDEQRQKIAQLRKAVEDCVDLQIGTEDVMMSKFLYTAQWNVAKAYDNIHRYYDFKAKHPTWVANHPPEHFKEHFLDVKCKFVMAKPDKDGRAITVSKSIDRFDKYPSYFYDLIEMDDLIFESLFLLPQVQKHGITIVFDLTEATKKFVKTVSPSNSKLINKKNDILPITNRYCHVIQRGFIMTTATSMMMPFMDKSVRERIFHYDEKNLKKFHDALGEDYVPVIYGGPEKNILDENLIWNHIMANREYLVKLQTYKKVGKIGKK